MKGLEALWLALVTMFFLYNAGALFRHYVFVIVSAIRGDKEPDDDTLWLWINFTLFGALTLVNTVKAFVGTAS